MSEREIPLPGRGTTLVREAAGPPGAPTLLLLHGLAATGGLNWYPSFGPLRRRFHVVAIDHRGHGRGIPVRGRFRLADCADDVAALADALGLERFIAVGYSMGGPIAQLVWHRHAPRVAGLVLCATMSSFARPQQRQAMLALSPLLHLASRAAPRSALRGLARQWLSDSIEDPDLRAYLLAEMGGMDPVAIAQAGAALARFDGQEWIGKVDVPTAVVVTEHDELVPPARQLAMARSIPGASVHRVAGDHRVCVGRPERFVPVLVEACVSVAERAGRAPRGV